jgi:hypothetical protein
MRAVGVEPFGRQPVEVLRRHGPADDRQHRDAHARELEGSRRVRRRAARALRAPPDDGAPSRREGAGGGRDSSRSRTPLKAVGTLRARDRPCPPAFRRCARRQEEGHAGAPGRRRCGGDAGPRSPRRVHEGQGRSHHARRADDPTGRRNRGRAHAARRRRTPICRPPVPSRSSRSARRPRLRQRRGLACPRDPHGSPGPASARLRRPGGRRLRRACRFGGCRVGASRAAPELGRPGRRRTRVSCCAPRESPRGGAHHG